MASAIGIALISTILELMVAKAMTMVVKKVCGVVNIKRDISRLQITLRMIQDIVQEAEEMQIDKKLKENQLSFIQNWLRDLVDIAYEARDVLDDFITYSSITASKPVKFISSLMPSCFCGSSSDTSNIPLSRLNKLAKDIRNVNERFDEKIKKSETFTKLKSVLEKFDDTTKKHSESVGEHRRPTVGPFTNKQRDGLFLGREEVKQGIMEKILHPSDDHAHVVLIWGMGGIGKTTLAQFIYNDERVKEDDYPTENRRWLCVGVNKFSAKEIIMKIICDSSTNDVESLQKKLVKKFMNKRFLIVLDDVWDVDGSEWDLLLNPLTHVGNGGLIIITRREKELCAAITIQTAYNLKPLSEEDSWSIFESYAYMNGKSDSTPDLKCIGKEIVKKLKGLPLALKVVGRSLLNKDSSTWTNFLESKLTKDDEVMSALRWSYNHLPRHVKTCFTYCSLFPKDHVLDKKVLVEMWMAHDLIQTEEDIGAHYFEQLINASLLQCVDGKYKMHDLIHDLALLVSNGEFANANGSLSIAQMEKVRHITITHDYSKIPHSCKIKKLLTLYTTSTTDDETYVKVDDKSDDEIDDETNDETDDKTDDETDDEIFPTEKSVLDESVLFKQLKGIRIVDAFKQMKSIRVMVLSSYDINEITDSIGELKHLRYLDVRKTNVKSLPDSLCHLYNLQMLAAPLNAKLPRDIVNISSLRYVRANLSTCKGVGKLTSLQELSSIHVRKGDNIRELGDMQRLCGKLRIKGLENVSTLEGTLMEEQTLMDKLELQFYQPKSNISAQVLDALKYPLNLMYLKIVGYPGVKSPSWMVDRKHKFAKLQILKLSNCPKLESLPPLGEFDKLQTLQLSDCPKLESLPPLGELTSLKHLSLWKVGVKRLGDEFYGKFTESKVFFPSLESLYFGNMQEWEEWDDIIIENSSVSFFPRLTRLKVFECPELVSVLPVVKKKYPIMNAANFMTSLSHLEIYECDGLKRLQLGASVSLKNLEIFTCESLERLQISQCEHLESLSIGECPQLQSLPPDFHKLSSLKRLSIYDCPQLESLPADGFAPSLRYLSILDCPLLYVCCNDESGLDWHKINHIPERQIFD